MGTLIWEKLWEKAREYSENHAYTGKDFPVTEEGSRCVLCHQQLSDNAKERFQSFEEFIKGELKKEASEKREEYKNSIESLDSLDGSESIKIRLEAIGIDDGKIIKQFQHLNSVLNKRLEKITKVKDLDKLPIIPDSWELLIKGRKISHAYLDKYKEYKKDAEEDNREGLTKEA